MSHLVFYNVICSWKIKLNSIFENITFEGNKHDASPYSFKSVGSVKIHHLVIR
jgi:hypothetical protein